MEKFLNDPTYIVYTKYILGILGISFIVAILFILCKPKQTKKISSRKSTNAVYNKLIVEQIQNTLEMYPDMKFGELLLYLGILQTGINKSGSKYTINPAGVTSKTIYNHLKYVKIESDLSENDD